MNKLLLLILLTPLLFGFTNVNSTYTSYSNNFNIQTLEKENKLVFQTDIIIESNNFILRNLLSRYNLTSKNNSIIQSDQPCGHHGSRRGN